MTTPTPSPPRAPFAWPSIRGEGLAVLAWFALLAVAVSWPIAARLDTDMLGMRWDTEQTGAAWVSWWFRTALSHGLYPWHCPWILYPVGSPDLLARMGISLNFLLAAPVMALVGFVPGYNLMILAILTLDGIAGYLLGRQVTGARTAGVALGSFLLTSHFLAAALQVAHPDNANLSGLLLYFAAMLCHLERGERWSLAGAGASLALATATFPGFAYLAALTAPALVLGSLASSNMHLDRRFLVRVLCLAAVSAVALAPFLGIWGQASEGEGARAGGEVVLPWVASQHALSVQDRIIVGNSMRWWGPWLSEVRHVLPISLALLAALGLMRSFRRAVPWLLVLLLFALLSCGPYLQLPGPHGQCALTPTPLLWAWWYLPWLDRWRFPIRFLWMCWIALAALGALGVQALIRAYQGWLRLGALAGVLVLCGYEMAYHRIVTIPVPTWEPPAPPRHYLDLAADDADLALIQVPLTIDKPAEEQERGLPVPTWPALDQYHQSFHGKRTVDGAWMSQAPQPLWLDFLHRNSLMAALMAWQRGETAPAVDGQDLDDLWALGFREVVLNDRYLLETDRDRLDENLTMLLGEPTFEEEGVMQVFALPVPGTRFQALSEEALAAVAEAEVGIAAVGQADAETLAVLVTRLQEAGYPARATVRLLAEVEARPDETWIREVLAESYAYRGLPALALASRAKARRLDPSSEEAPPVQRTPAALHPIATR